MAGLRRQRYGPDLAELVADSLVAGHELAAHHRDYCGMGLEHRGGTFYYGEVWVGQLHGWTTHENRAATLVAFATRAAFVAWLSAQSDYSLSRRELSESFYQDNQTISRQRLQIWRGRMLPAVARRPCFALPDCQESPYQRWRKCAGAAPDG